MAEQLANAQKKEEDSVESPDSHVPPVVRADNINVNEIHETVRKYYDDSARYQERRQHQWKETYQLYRDKVVTNRITQRQSVNIPMMKETVKTLLANMDDPTDITFEDKGNEEQRAIYLGAMWDDDMERNKLELKDIVDKRNVLLFGRSFMKLNIKNGRSILEVRDPTDLLVDRHTDPTDTDTARYACHRNIYRTMGELEAHPLYDSQKLKTLKQLFATNAGQQEAATNLANVARQAEKLKDLGDTAALSPQLGETYLELREHYIKITDPKTVEYHNCQKDGFVLMVVVTCKSEVLMIESMKFLLGLNELPIVSWADEVEATDYWSDGSGDVTRTSNIVVNAWFSQLVENRTLRNFGMHYYDATVENFHPASFVPQPWGWIPVQGEPDKVMKKVDVPDLSESLDEINFVINLNERATAATATIKGETKKGSVTLGEIELVDKKAMERITATAKFYRIARRQLAEKYARMLVANADRLDKVDLFKRAASGKYYKVHVSPRDFSSRDGFKVAVISSAEQEQSNLETLQKLQVVEAAMPFNIPLKRVSNEKRLDLIDLPPESRKEIMDFEENTLKNPPPISPEDQDKIQAQVPNQVNQLVQ